nr:lipopolysaccharide transport periplasmic protein LptA [uncultured Desulfobulbus sp.]
MELKKCIRLRMLPLLIIILLFPLSMAAGAEQANKPISIEANRMISQEKDNIVIFLGKVDARQGTLTIRADEMTVYYSAKPTQGKETDPSSSRVEKLICKDNVKVSQDDWLGTGERMDYYALERKVVLQGDAKAWQGQNMVAGKTITYYLDKKRSVVEQDTSKNGRVRAIIHPESK